ncbi:MAG TPA: alpha/beta fold hydrolase [Sphaerochaeta sp.]|nr:alpha/beta fold hydrolase [Sphaerochaeta sp.]
MQITYAVPSFTDKLYQDQSSVRKCARAWAMLHPQRPKKVALLLHGYAGYPGELIRPGIDLYQAGWDVYTPRLPGHGTSGEDFLQSRGSDWLGTFDAAYRYLLEAGYQEISLVGHSMGTLMAIILASRYSVDRIALVAPALIIPSLPGRQLRFLRHFVQKKHVGWQADPAYRFLYEGDADDDAYLGEHYWSYIYPKQLWELEKLRRLATSLVEHLEADTLTITGGKDTIVDEAGALLVASKQAGENRHLHIPLGGHYLLYDKDQASQDATIEAIVAWLERT